MDRPLSRNLTFWATFGSGGLMNFTVVLSIAVCYLVYSTSYVENLYIQET